MNVDLAQIDGRWPLFGPKAVEAGFRSVHAVPMRLRKQTIGALNLYRVDGGTMSDTDVVAAQALADVATIAILQHRAVRDAQLLNEQLSQALNTRIVIEQAKGVVAERADLDMEAAFARLRRHARNHNLRLSRRRPGDQHQDAVGVVPRCLIALKTPGRWADARETGSRGVVPTGPGAVTLGPMVTVDLERVEALELLGMTLAHLNDAEARREISARVPLLMGIRDKIANALREAT